MYVGPASTTSERQPERLTGRHIRFSSIALWSMQALSSQIRGCVSPSLRTPSVFAHSSSRAYLAAPSSDHECDTNPSTSPSFAARVLAWSPESVELLRSAAVSALSGNARKCRAPSSSARLAAPPPMSAAIDAASASLVPVLPRLPSQR